MAKTVTVRNTLTGKVASIPERIFLSPVFNPEPRHLVLAEPGAKPYVGAYKPKTAEEFEAVHPDKVLQPEEVEIEDTPKEED